MFRKEQDPTGSPGIPFFEDMHYRNPITTTSGQTEKSGCLIVGQSTESDSGKMNTMEDSSNRMSPTRLFLSSNFPDGEERVLKNALFLRFFDF